MKKLIAFTFDDSPNPDISNKLMDILKETHAKATFMIQGNLIEHNDDLLKRMVNEGHQLGNHTFSHGHLPEISADEIKEEIAHTTTAVEAITGISPHVVRPPYGEYNTIVKEAIDYPLILWTIDSGDWDHNTTHGIISRIKERAFDGAIVLMHDSYMTTVEAVKVLIPYLQEQDYNFVTLDEMMKQRQVTMQPHTPYFSTDITKTSF